MARLSSLTAERREAVERALATGAPLSVAAEAAGASPRTVSRWIQDGHVVRRELAPVMELDPQAEELLAGAIAEERLVGLIAEAAKTQWRAAAWILERRYSERWATPRTRFSRGRSRQSAKKPSESAGRSVWTGREAHVLPGAARRRD